MSRFTAGASKLIEAMQLPGSIEIHRPTNSVSEDTEKQGHGMACASMIYAPCKRPMGWGDKLCGFFLRMLYGQPRTHRLPWRLDNPSAAAGMTDAPWPSQRMTKRHSTQSKEVSAAKQSGAHVCSRISGSSHVCSQPSGFPDLTA